MRPAVNSHPLPSLGNDLAPQASISGRVVGASANYH